MPRQEELPGVLFFLRISNLGGMRGSVNGFGRLGIRWLLANGDRDTIVVLYVDEFLARPENHELNG